MELVTKMKDGTTCGLAHGDKSTIMSEIEYQKKQNDVYEILVDCGNKRMTIYRSNTELFTSPVITNRYTMEKKTYKTIAKALSIIGKMED